MKIEESKGKDQKKTPLCIMFITYCECRKDRKNNKTNNQNVDIAKR